MNEQAETAQTTDPRVEYVFTCECGSNLFYLLMTGAVRCAQCGGVDDKMHCLSDERPQ